MITEQQALDRAGARIRLNDEADREWRRLVQTSHYRDQHEAFLDGYAAGGLAALPERFVQPDLAVLRKPLTQANAVDQALAHFHALVFTVGGDRDLALRSAMARAVNIGAHVVVQASKDKP